jgi:hypothetical protein
MDGLAFKSRDIEESVDVYFFGGSDCLRHGRGPSACRPGVVRGDVRGGCGRALLARPQCAMLGVALLVMHGVLDSSDGHGALTGNSTEFGRMMDSVAGYVTPIAINIGILASGLSRGWGWDFGRGRSSPGSTIVHAQMCDYHRSA